MSSTAELFTYERDDICENPPVSSWLLSEMINPPLESSSVSSSNSSGVVVEIRSTGATAAAITTNATTTASTTTTNATTITSSANASAVPSPTIEEDEPIYIIGEIVGGCKLGIGHSFHSETQINPRDNMLRSYCIIRFGHDFIHRTKEADEECCGRNPIWTLSTRSIFLLEASPRELAECDLSISVWHKQKDPLNFTTLRNEFLGKVDVDASLIVSEYCRQERVEFDLTDDDDDPGMNGTITVRFRMAAPSDENFLQELYGLPTASMESPNMFSYNEVRKDRSPWAITSPKASVITEMDEALIAGASFVNALSSAFTFKSYIDHQSKQTKILVKPGPDPNRPTETMYLSPDEIKHQTFLPSLNWVEAGSGHLGKLYLEILCCDDLPNVDVGEAVGNVTDCFICAIFEDVMVQTIVIDDELNPCWLPWTQRAFVLNIMYPASMLYLGAFDFDFGLVNHDALGRVAINLMQFKRNVDYTLTYELYPSANITDRTSAGTVTIRLRLEYYDERAALLAALQPRPKFHVNVDREKSLQVVRYTCFGEYGDQNDEKFDLTVLRSYINEIMEYKTILQYCLSDTLQSLVFWRGQVKVMKLHLPIHSYLFFWACTTIIEKPHMIVPFVLLGIAWIMLASLTLRLQHPSPWNRCPTFWEYLEVLCNGRSSGSSPNIEKFESLDHINSFEKALKDRLAKDQKEAAERAARRNHLNAIGDESIHTKLGGGIPLDLLDKLGSYQATIGRYCSYARFAKIIFTWEEGHLSFWLTFCFLAAGLMALILPWAFILRWTSRIFVWTFLGPHMMIVDAFMQENAANEKSLAESLRRFQEDSRTARYRRQDAIKIKDAKCLAFGRFITRVPSFNLSRHFDRPLPCSFSNHRTVNVSVSAKHFIPGQQFFLNGIIPRTESQLKNHLLNFDKLEHHRMLVDRTIKSIIEGEKCVGQRVKRNSCAMEDLYMPSAVGYELVSLDGTSFGERIEDDSDQSGDRKICDRLGGNHNSMKTYLACHHDEPKYESHVFSTNTHNAIHMGTTSSIAANASLRLAIIPTRQDRRRSSLLSIRTNFEQSATQSIAAINVDYYEIREGAIELVILE